MRKSSLLLVFVLHYFFIHGQKIILTPSQQKIIITSDGKPFTEFLYPDTLEKHTLYPIYAPDGQVITRGFPVNPQPGDPTDHPHHLGLWLNYESVNKLDFWNNSYNIKPERKHLYGWIRVDSILEMENGRVGKLKVASTWHDQQKNSLMKETTTFQFSEENGHRIIDRFTTFIAEQKVEFADVKDGMLGLRVIPELQIPSKEDAKFTDQQNNTTTVSARVASTGNYLTSEGKQGDSAWGTRGKWCLLYGTKNNSVISIAILDHPSNPGYPTYWHARGYGLFAANPLGQKIFSNGKEIMNLTLQKGESVSFRYRVVLGSGKSRISNNELEKHFKEFAKLK